MVVTLSTRVCPAPAVLAQQIEDEIVLLHTHREQYFALNAVASRMWRLLGEAASLQDVFEAMHREYQVPPEDLQADLEHFIEELAVHGLVEVDGS
jgi:hypothetical protein